MTYAVHGIFKKSIKKYAILKEQHLHGCENFFHFYFPFPTIFFFLIICIQGTTTYDLLCSGHCAKPAWLIILLNTKTF